MPLNLRNGLLAVVTTAVVLSVPSLAIAAPAAPTQAAAASDRSSAQPEARRFTQATAKKALAKVVDVFARTGSRTAPRTTPLPRTDATLALRDLRLARSSLSRSDKAVADTYLARSGVTTQSSCNPGGNVIATTHFCVRYTPKTLLFPGGSTTEQAQTTASTLEYVYAQEIGVLGYRAPRNDGDGRLDVYLQNVGAQRLYGYCDVGQDTRVSTAYCVLDNDFSTAEYGAPPAYSLRVTAAHEFFHAVQFAYDAYDDLWFMEGTAVWMEDQVFPDINDYYQYLSVSQIKRPRNSLDVAGDLEKYGAVTFWKFLSERFKDVNIIRTVWNYAAVSNGNRNGLQSVLATTNFKGASLPTEFGRYAYWNTLARDTYADRAHYPAPGYVTGKTFASNSRDTGVRSLKLNHLANAPLLFVPGSSLSSRTTLRLTVNGPDKVRGTQAWVQVRLRNGVVGVVQLPLNSAGNAVRAFQFNPKTVLAVVVTLTNASGGWNGQDFSFRAIAQN